MNFVAATTDVAAGFGKDFGRAFSNTRGYGWVSPTTGAPLNLVGNGRFRDVRAGVTVDIRQRGLMHMQGDDVPSTFNGIATEGEWEAAVPDGTYSVTVSVGDQPGSSTASCPAPCYDSQHSVNVEGVEAIDAFQATATDEFETATVVAEVTDGRLTIDADGGTNTKINFVDVEVADLAAPAAPTGVVATSGDGQNTLEWAANAESDVVGYHVYASTDENVAAEPGQPPHPGHAPGGPHLHPRQPDQRHRLPVRRHRRRPRRQRVGRLRHRRRDPAGPHGPGARVGAARDGRRLLRRACVDRVHLLRRRLLLGLPQRDDAR